MTVYSKHLFTRCTCANLRVGRKCSWCTVRCHSTVAAAIFQYHLRQNHHDGQSHPSKHQQRPQHVNWNLRTPSQCINSFLHEFRILCTRWGHVPVSNTGTVWYYLNLNMHTLSSSGIKSSTRLVSYGNVAVHPWLSSLPESKFSALSFAASLLAEAKWGLRLWIGGGRDCSEFFKRSYLPTARARSLKMRAAVDLRWNWLNLRISWLYKCPAYTGEQTGRAISNATFAISASGDSTVSCVKNCVGETFHTV